MILILVYCMIFDTLKSTIFKLIVCNAYALVTVLYVATYLLLIITWLSGTLSFSMIINMHFISLTILDCSAMEKRTNSNDFK